MWSVITPTTGNILILLSKRSLASDSALRLYFNDRGVPETTPRRNEVSLRTPRYLNSFETRP